MTVKLTIKIPEDSVLITKVEYEQLKQSDLAGVYWKMKDLEAKTGYSENWIKENILFQPSLRRLLDQDTGGFVFYPKANRQMWTFQAKKMAEFLEDKFALVFKKYDERNKNNERTAIKSRVR